MQNDDKTLPSISPTGRGQLVKLLITLEPHGINWSKLCLLMHINIVRLASMLNGDEALPKKSIAAPTPPQLILGNPIWKYILAKPLNRDCLACV